MDTLPIKNTSNKDLRRLCDVAIQHCRAVKVANNDTFNTVLTVILQQKLDNNAWLKWVENSNDSERVPPCTKSFKFLDLQVTHLESVSHTGHKQAPGPDHKMPVKLSFVASTDDTCLACKNQGHQMNTCGVFKCWILMDNISIVRDLGLCMNCLKIGHLAENC